MSAHRRDEYLQAARIALAPDRARIDLDLTPGIAVAETVLADIDRDRSGTISAGEARDYARRVRQAITLDVDGTPLVVALADVRFPEIAAIRNGEGAIHIELGAIFPAASAGPHHLRYRNTHRADIGAYLANVLVPASDRVSVSSQRRDVDQRELVVDYVLRADPMVRARRWWLAAVAGVWIALAVVWRRRRR